MTGTYYKIDRLVRKSSATADERTDVDDERTDTDDGCTDAADGGTFPRRPVRKYVRGGDFLCSKYLETPQINLIFATVIVNRKHPLCIDLSPLSLRP